ncbi:hypothetical protein EI94DRAFT_1739454 [Lactarius quietus]|nr:hypothetical protein EI94DRAFT_1739454 [Lactarius quietus]
MAIHLMVEKDSRISWPRCKPVSDKLFSTSKRRFTRVQLRMNRWTTSRNISKICPLLRRDAIVTSSHRATVAKLGYTYLLPHISTQLLSRCRCLFTCAACSRFTFLHNPASPNGDPGRHRRVSSLLSHLIQKDILSKATPSRLLQVLGPRGDPASKQEG